MLLKADLHIHSTASDGYLSPREIVTLAKSRGIDTIAISDHNSIDGITEASESGEQYGISVIPAVELSTIFNGESIHILGYFKNRKFERNDFKKLLKLIKNNKADDVRSVFGGYRKHHTPNNYLDCSEGIFLLKTFGASVVLAHPFRVTEENLSSLLNLPFDGVEAKCCGCSDYYTKFFIETALKRFSFYTGGSDFHTDKISDSKHCLIGEPYLDSAEIRRFLESSGVLILGNSPD